MIINVKCDQLREIKGSRRNAIKTMFLKYKVCFTELNIHVSGSEPLWIGRKSRNKGFERD